ncbi:hypothetical protein [Desulfosarcina sp.]|uniref:hypothetical protein n=1 Tax=Desulfosarcina sp. TaxID=2027861 RepID=UPI0029BEE15C|nr:hypothetical protein [Desulfosarcina sp.]MDX2455299.1 hypothetical protein [Desulfosarcina sp.]
MRNHPSNKVDACDGLQPRLISVVKQEIKVMKTMLIMIVAVNLTACVHTESGESQSTPNHSAATGLEKQNPKDRYQELNQPEIEQRAKHFENEGLSPEEALATAQIEYLRSTP